MTDGGIEQGSSGRCGSDALSDALMPKLKVTHVSLRGGEGFPWL